MAIAIAKYVGISPQEAYRRFGDHAPISAPLKKIPSSRTSGKSDKRRPQHSLARRAKTGMIHLSDADIRRLSRQRWTREQKRLAGFSIARRPDGVVSICCPETGSQLLLPNVHIENLIGALATLSR